MAAPALEQGCLTLVCADLDARPLFWTDTGGGRHGFEPAVAVAIGARPGLETSRQNRRWADFESALDKGAAAAVVDGEPAFGGLIAAGEFEIAFTVETGNRWAAD